MDVADGLLDERRELTGFATNSAQLSSGVSTITAWPTMMPTKPWGYKLRASER
jgi:hypothetical protein